MTNHGEEVCSFGKFLQVYLGLWIEEVVAITPACDLMAGGMSKSRRWLGDPRDSKKRKNLVNQDSSRCSRSFRYKFRSLIPRILAALPR